MYSYSTTGNNLAYAYDPAVTDSPADAPKPPSPYEIATLAVKYNRTDTQPVAQRLDGFDNITRFGNAHKGKMLDVHIPYENGEPASVELKGLIEKAHHEKKDYIVISTAEDSTVRYALSVTQAEQMQAKHDALQKEYKIPYPVPLHISGGLAPEAAALYDVTAKGAVATKTVLSMGKLGRPMKGISWTLAHEMGHHQKTVTAGRTMKAIAPADKRHEELEVDEKATRLEGKMAAFSALGNETCSCTSDKNIPATKAINATYKNLMINMQQITGQSTHPSVYHRLKLVHMQH